MNQCTQIHVNHHLVDQTVNVVKSIIKLCVHVCQITSVVLQLVDQNVLSTQIVHLTSPPACRPECTVNSDCPLDKACVNQKCVDPCPGSCGQNANCRVINHSPICTCRPGYTGEPRIRCSIIPPPPPPLESPPEINPCAPSPCGPYSQCRNINGNPSCSCLPSYIGNPPYCRPECVMNSECASNLACINEKCRDPCPGSCGYNAQCKVINHTPICTCHEGFIGDPFTACSPKPPEIVPPPVHDDICNCVPNAVCQNEVCVCLPDFYGDGYVSCRPECVLNSDCPSNKACIRNKCKNPCVPGTCGEGAICDVINHAVSCSCPPGTTGSPFIQCRPIQNEPVYTNPCQPSPCGPNSQCREVNHQAVCSCLPNYFGSPPACRPECTVNSDCPLDKACFNQKCVDPCPGSCGYRARCSVYNHEPVCTCPPGYTGNPFSQCLRPPPPAPVIRDEEPPNPCIPSPCGPNSQCKVSPSNTAQCSCLPTFIGSPPYCRPECTSNSDCPYHLACINTKCQDPCPGTCGVNAECTVRAHRAQCVCIQGYQGDPFSFCRLIPPRKYRCGIAFDNY
ncbi:hypothetical protein WDU94_006202 [Cyamophila willieti]